MKTTVPHQLRFRQVHLDFHTSGDIPDVGEKFDKAQFQEALRIGHVDSITVFSKCHHGWSYHTTNVGKSHPTLKRDLLGEQIEACREIGVRCPIYISAGYDELAAALHPEWMVVDADGSTGSPLGRPRYRRMSFNSPYLDYLCAQIEEVVQRWPDNDGIFLDIIAPWQDFSRENLFAMRQAGLNPESPDDMANWSQTRLKEYYKRTTAAVKSVRADTPVFHNGGHIPIGADEFNLMNSHFELESLPTGGWGYDHFPLSARYAITTPRDFLGMTGKFHTTWGEFGGFKRPAALQYECAAMIAQGAKCSVGDQLHPNGEMNLDTYRLIGSAYAQVAQKETWVTDVETSAKIAIISAENPQSLSRFGNTVSPADEGAARMLLELHLPFVIFDEHADWKGMDLVILPDTFKLSTENRRKAMEFLEGGGKILAAGSALLTEDESSFAINPGANLLGRSPYDPDYLVATDLTPNVAVKSPIVIEQGAYQIEPTTAEVLVGRKEPYFNRTWEHFCSHQHAPYAPNPASPAAVISSQIAYFAHNIFSQYRQRGQPLYRDFVKAALVDLLPDGLPVETNLPSVARISVMNQVEIGRTIIHLLYAPISLRAFASYWGSPQPVEIIEELIPLVDTMVKIKTDKVIKSVVLAPSGEPLPFEQESGTVSFTVAKFTGHQMVVLNWLGGSEAESQ